jgi:hypothetical protein
MKNLNPDVRKLVEQGIYSLYRLKNGHIVLYVPASRPCCSIFGHLEAIYHLSEDGDVLATLGSDWDKDGVAEVIRI